MSDEKQVFAAFLAVRPTQDGEGYLGGLMVIDKTGVPQEFRCTHPIRPTEVQKAVYGGSLRPHIFNELIGLTLIRAMTTNPTFCCIEESILLETAQGTEIPVVHLQRLGETLSVEHHADEKVKNSNGILRVDSHRSGFQPLSATFHRDFEDDLEKIKGDLELVFNQVDLLEPFERIATAIRVLSERDERFR